MSFSCWFGSEHYRDHFKDGTYNCAECNTPLFDSVKKYEHTSPWPAFFSLIHLDLVSRHQESPSAIKISCAKCGNSLGHEFLNDGPQLGKNRY
uniref:peptide-methionine (R)-S-oxide reductase n=2 Tax=Octopus bimaculoides TaxID=37653 RepID=A0A0L8G6K5_OCTBM